MTPIDILPDDVLLAIFDFFVNYFEYLDEDRPSKEELEEWQLLVHVCQRWRSVVFGSPRRLNLQLVCTPRTPVPDILDTWPAFPLVIQYYDDHHPISGLHNVLAALNYHDRIRRIHIEQICEEFPWMEIHEVMQAPLPELTNLVIEANDSIEHPDPCAVLPNRFLGGSAPRLQVLNLDVDCPGLPILLSSTTHLVHLLLWDTFGYIASDEIVSCLSTLTSLGSLTLRILGLPPTHPPESQPLPTHTVLSALTSFTFSGDIGYFEDMVARITCPKLNRFSIDFTDVIIDHDFHSPQLEHFISRSRSLRAQYNWPIFHSLPSFEHV